MSLGFGAAMLLSLLAGTQDVLSVAWRIWTAEKSFVKRRAKAWCSLMGQTVLVVVCSARASRSFSPKYAEHRQLSATRAACNYLQRSKAIENDAFSYLLPDYSSLFVTTNAMSNFPTLNLHLGGNWGRKTRSKSEVEVGYLALVCHLFRFSDFDWLRLISCWGESGLL